MTFYMFSHYLQAWLLPPGIIFLMMAAGLVLGLFSRKLGSLLLLLGVLSLWLFSMPRVAYGLINFLQDQYPVLQAENLNTKQPKAAIVVLGGGSTVQAEYGNQEVVSDTTLHRVNYGVYLQQKTGLPLILSGGKAPGSTTSEAELMAKVAQESYHVKPAYLENQSLTTADESRLLKPLLQDRHLDQIYLVTHAWHMPRSVYIFECSGIRVLPAPMGHSVYGPGYSLISYFPNMDALYASSIAMHEFLGLFWYKLRYGKQCSHAKV